ncbi:MAG: M81 family metallopeptidase, partial [Acetobacteraceae bacterium]
MDLIALSCNAGGMTQRIAIGGFLHETHSFAPRPTTWPDFLQPGGFPRLQHGPGLIEALRRTSVPIAGAIAEGEQAGAELVPLAWTIASPAGPIEDEAFERIAALICARLSDALEEAPLDGVYLDLHGAALAESFPDAEGELLRRLRAIIRGDLPLTISLDPHANLTREMVERTDVVVPFRTYPHVDMKAAGAQAMRLLLSRIDNGRPWKRAFRQIDFWLPLGSQCTLMQPMAGVMEQRAALAERTGLAELAWCFGFPYADFAGCGPALAAYADTQGTADAAADEFAALIAARESTFVQETFAAAEAVAEAKRLVAEGRRPVVLADTQDNPGGGGHGDTTGLLAELVRQRAAGAVVCLINDDESAAACHSAGEDAVVKLSLGGKSDGMPLACTGRV